MSPNEDEHKKIEELKKALYSRQGPPVYRQRKILHDKQYDVPKLFQPIEEGSEKPLKVGDSDLFKKIFLASIFFFVIALGVAYYLYSSGSNVVSGKNVVISVLGPTSIGAGEQLSVDIDVANKNTVDLQLVDLVIAYPDGTRKADDPTTDLPRDRISLGTIHPGEIVQKTIKAVLFGQQGDAKPVHISVEYRLAGSNAVFHSDKDYQIAIGSSPVSLTIDSLKEINSGQQITLKAKVTSNSAALIKGLLFKMDFPFGFQYQSATPVPVLNQNTWSLGDLEPGGSREISITGKIVGQDNDERVFRFYTGTQSSSTDNTIATVFIDTTQAVVVKQPFLAVNLTLDGDSSDPHISNTGQNLRGEINWVNNLTTPLNDLVIDVALAGPVLNRESVTSSGGFYTSSNNTISWSSETDPDLVAVKPGDTGKVVFEFSANDLTADQFINSKNPEMDLNVTVHSKRFSETNVPEDIVSTVSRSVKINANLGLQGNLTHEANDTGPLPPKADTPTSYTVNLKVSNALNDVKNAYVLAKLPQYVSWLSNANPSGSISYNPVTREVRWDIGSLNAGVGYNGNAARQATFQISFLPSLSQLGNTPPLVTDLSVYGGDTFTGKEIQTDPQTLQSKLSTNSDTLSDKDRVVR